VQTDRTTPNNKPDNIICDNEKGTCMITDVAISGDRKVIKKETEKILKYEDLTIDIQRMWSIKTKVIPVTTGGQLEPSYNKQQLTVFSICNKTAVFSVKCEPIAGLI
jgi:hypothetical protein